MTQDRAIVEKAWMKAADLAIKFLGSTKGPKLAAEMGEWRVTRLRKPPPLFQMAP